jgi:hypothetical protein
MPLAANHRKRVAQISPLGALSVFPRRVLEVGNRMSLRIEFPLHVPGIGNLFLADGIATECEPLASKNGGPVIL